ncbi:MAG: hypothetical protein ACRD0S_09150, partial [Acidimicrobiales bacterium]
MQRDRSTHAPLGGLAGFAGGSLPEPEGRGRSALIRTVAVVALAASVAYLTWRAMATLDLSVWWVSIPLLALEAHAVAGLGLFTFSLWDVDPP